MPEESLADFERQITHQTLALDFAETADRNMRNGTPWEQVEQLGHVYGVSPGPMRRGYEVGQQLHQARERHRDWSPSTGDVFTASSLPGISTFRGIADPIEANNAAIRIRAGRERPGDFDTLARHERQEERWHEVYDAAGRGDPHAIATMAFGGVATVPAMLGEALAGGAVAGRVAGTSALAGRSLSSMLATRGTALRAGATLAGEGVARAAATTTLTPAMYLPHFVQSNIAQGRHPSDPAGFPAAYGLGLTQTAVLGTLGPLGRGVTTGGIQGAALRTLVRTGGGVLEQQGADLLATAIARTVPAMKEMDTGYGLLGNALSGQWGEFWKHAAVQAATFGAFSAFHELQEGRPHAGPEGYRPGQQDAAAAFQLLSQGLAERGVPRDKAGAILSGVAQRMDRSLTGERPMDRPEDIRDPALRDYVTVMQELAGGGAQSDFLRQRREALAEPQQQPAQGPRPGLEGMPERLTGAPPTAPRVESPVTPEQATAALAAAKGMGGNAVAPAGRTPPTTTIGRLAELPEADLRSLAKQLLGVSKGEPRGLAEKLAKVGGIEAVLDSMQAPPQPPKTAAPSPPATPEPPKAREPFLGPLDVALNRLRAKLKRSGMSEAHAEAAVAAAREEGLHAPDMVTGYHKAEVREPTTLRAIEHIKETGEPGVYVEMDLKNLGGVNSKLGNSGANEFFRKVADIIREEVHGLPADAHLFRHGGDEMSALVVNATKDAVTAAMRRAHHRIAEAARQFGLADIEHPKHPGVKEKRGTGVTFGLSEIGPGDKPKDIFGRADKEVEARKKSVEQAAEPTPSAPQVAPEPAKPKVGARVKPLNAQEQKKVAALVEKGVLKPEEAARLTPELAREVIRLKSAKQFNTEPVHPELEDRLAAFAERAGLTDREHAVVTNLLRGNGLRYAGEEIGTSHEKARTVGGEALKKLKRADPETWGDVHRIQDLEAGASELNENLLRNQAGGTKDSEGSVEVPLEQHLEEPTFESGPAVANLLAARLTEARRLGRNPITYLAEKHPELARDIPHALLLDVINTAKEYHDAEVRDSRSAAVEPEALRREILSLLRSSAENAALTAAGEGGAPGGAGQAAQGPAETPGGGQAGEPPGPPAAAGGRPPGRDQLEIAAGNMMVDALRSGDGYTLGHVEAVLQTEYRFSREEVKALRAKATIAAGANLPPLAWESRGANARERMLEGNKARYDIIKAINEALMPQEVADANAELRRRGEESLTPEDHQAIVAGAQRLAQEAPQGGQAVGGAETPERVVGGNLVDAAGNTLFAPGQFPAPGGATPGPAGGVKGPFEIIAEIKKQFGMPVYQESQLEQNARALYKVNPEAMMVNGMTVGEAPYYLHELAHHLATTEGINLNPRTLPADVAAGFGQFDYQPNRANRVVAMQEGFAEWLRRRETGQLGQLSPEQQAAAIWAEKQLSWKKVEFKNGTWVSTEPRPGDLLKKADAVRDMFAEFTKQAPGVQAASLMSGTGQAPQAQQAATEKLATLGEQFREAVDDRLGVLRRLEGAAKTAAGFVARVGENAYTVWSRLMFADKATAGEFSQNGVHTIEGGHKKVIGPSEAKIIEGLLPADLADYHQGVSKASVYAVARHVLFEASKSGMLAPPHPRATSVVQSGPAKGQPIWEARERVAVSPEQLEMYQKAMADFQKDPEFVRRADAYADRLTEAFNATRRALVPVGRLTAEEVAYYEKLFPNYIELARVQEKGWKLWTGRAREQMPAVFRQRQGSGEQIVDPMLSLKKRYQVTAWMMNEQLRRNAAYPYLKADGMGDWALENPTTETTRLSDSAKLTKNVLEALGMSEPDVLKVLQQMGGRHYAATLVHEPWQKDPDKNTWYHFVDGQLTSFRVKDRALYDLLTGQQGDASSTVQLFRAMANWAPFGGEWKPFSAQGRLVRTGATALSLGFQVRNALSPFRDPYEFLKNTIDRSSVGQLPEALARAYRFAWHELTGGTSKDVLFRMFADLRGEGMRQFAFDKQAPESAYDQARPMHGTAGLLHWVLEKGKAALNVAGAGELGPRFLEFRNRLKQAGWTEERIIREEVQARAAEAKGRPYVDPVPYFLQLEAAHAANEVTVPFDRQGTLTAEVNKIIPFFGPQVAGMSKMMRNWKDNPKGAAVAMSGFLALRLLHWLLVKDEPWYKELQAHDRYDNFVLPIGGKLWRVPGARDVEVPVGGGMIAMLDAITRRRPDFAGLVQQSVGQMLPPGVSRPAASLARGDVAGAGLEAGVATLGPLGQVGLDVARNKNWMGTPIVPRRDEHAPALQNLWQHQLPYAAQQLTGGRGELSLRGAGVVPFSEVRNAHRSVDELHDALEGMQAERLAAQRMGRVYPRESEYQALHHADAAIRQLSMEYHGSQRVGHVVRAGQAASPARQAEIRRQQARLAQEALAASGR